jgi:hypothetical protein
MAGPPAAPAGKTEQPATECQGGGDLAGGHDAGDELQTAIARGQHRVGGEAGRKGEAGAGLPGGARVVRAEHGAGTDLDLRNLLGDQSDGGQRGRGAHRDFQRGESAGGQGARQHASCARSITITGMTATLIRSRKLMLPLLWSGPRTEGV